MSKNRKPQGTRGGVKSTDGASDVILFDVVETSTGLVFEPSTEGAYSSEEKGTAILLELVEDLGDDAKVAAHSVYAPNAKFYLSNLNPRYVKGGSERKFKVPYFFLGDIVDWLEEGHSLSIAKYIGGKLQMKDLSALRSSGGAKTTRRIISRRK